MKDGHTYLDKVVAVAHEFSFPLYVSCDQYMAGGAQSPDILSGVTQEKVDVIIDFYSAIINRRAT